MADDLYVRLQKALDEAETLTRGCTQGEWAAAVQDGKVPVIGVRGPTPGTGTAIAVFGGLGSRAGQQSQPANDARHAVRWAPSTAHRLIKRDRRLLADFTMVQQQCEEISAKVVAAWRPGGDGASIPRLQEHAERVEGRLDALKSALESAAEFWLTDTETTDG